MTLSRWSPNRVRGDESPDLVTSRNFDSLFPVLNDYAKNIETLITQLNLLTAKASRQGFPSLQGVALRVGANSKMGSATLVAGTVTVANTSITATSLIFLSRAATGGTLTHLSYTITAGTGFVINSSSATDTSTINFLIMEQF